MGNWINAKAKTHYIHYIQRESRKKVWAKGQKLTSFSKIAGLNCSIFYLLLKVKFFLSHMWSKFGDCKVRRPLEGLSKIIWVRATKQKTNGHLEAESAMRGAVSGRERLQELEKPNE